LEDGRNRLRDPSAIVFDIAGIHGQVAKIDNAARVVEAGEQRAANVEIQLIKLAEERL